VPLACSACSACNSDENSTSYTPGLGNSSKSGDLP
jgi:hypothetical protein